MTKKELAQRCPQFIAFEDQTLLLVKERLIKYNEILDHFGLALDIDLIWFYQGEELNFSRIEFANGYTCAINIQVGRKEDPKYDLDLKAINYIHPISMYGKSLIRYFLSLPSKYSKITNKMLDEFSYEAEQTIKRVIDESYEVVLQDMLKSKNI